MAPDVDIAKHWRSLAEDAMRIAAELTDPVAKQEMLLIAHGYEKLAQFHETREDPEKPR